VCETKSLTLREEHRFRVFDNWVLKISRKINGWLMGEMRDAYKVLVGKPEGKRPYDDIDADGRIILEYTLGENVMRMEDGWN
jgi:hypothetical protein